MRCRPLRGGPAGTILSKCCVIDPLFRGRYGPGSKGSTEMVAGMLIAGFTTTLAAFLLALLVMGFGLLVSSGIAVASGTLITTFLVIRALRDSKGEE